MSGLALTGVLIVTVIALANVIEGIAGRITSVRDVPQALRDWWNER